MQLSDHKSYRYDPDIWYERWLNKPAPQNLVNAVLGGKTLLLEFQPFMVASATVAKFDVSGLRREFDKAPECKLEDHTSTASNSALTITALV